MSLSHLHKPVLEVKGLSLYMTDDIAIVVMDRGENRLNIDFLESMSTILDHVEKYAFFFVENVSLFMFLCKCPHFHMSYFL